MFARLLQPFRRSPPPPALPAAAPAVAAQAAAAAGTADEPPQLDAPPLFAWLLGVSPAPYDSGPEAAAQALLASLDRRLGAPALPPDLLPRAANVIPQLLALMRRGSAARQDMVAQVLKDPQLTAEVLRLARSPAYGATAVDTLESALDRIGTSGLEAATARLLLRPVFASNGNGALGQACARIAALSESKSLLCAQLAQQASGDRLDGLLAGLLHDTGTLGLLRLADRSGYTTALAAGLAGSGAQGLEQSLLMRRDRLFGRLVAGWDLTPTLTALAGHLGAPLPDSSPPLARALLMADRCARVDLARQG